MKKKFLNAILCAAMGVTMLAGCGSSGGNGGDSSQSASAKSDDSGEIYMFISQPEFADAIGELIDEYKREFNNPYKAAERGMVDDVIIPSTSRQMIIAALEMLDGKVVESPRKKHGNVPL